MDTPSVESAIRVDPPVAFRPTWAGDALALAFDPGLRFGTTYTLTVDPAATDTGGAHLSEPFVTHFSTVSAGLASTVVPADGVAGIAVRSPIAVEFDGPIEPDSIADALSITPAVAGDAEVVPRSDGSGASTLVFTPSSPLAEHTTYTVSLASGVHRLGDPSQVAAARTWSFTTGSPTASAQNQIAFLSDRSGVRNVWLVNPDGTNARQLTWELAPVTTFDVTGDGRRLTFGAGDVVGTLNVDGDDRRILTDDGFHEFAPRLSPDETAILLSRRDPTGADLGWWSVPTPWTFGDERQVLVAGAPELDGDAPDPNSQPAFDTSGRYAIVSAGGELVVLDLAPSSGGSVIAVRTGVAPAGTPAWSASASAFAAVGLSARDDVSRVQLIGLDGTVTTIAGTDKATEALTVDEHGRLAFVIDQRGAGRWIQLLDPASGRSVELTSDADLIDAGPAFSPDGRRVVFARSRRDPYESAGLWLIDLESRVVTRLTIDGSEPRWLP
jgi:Tol biopolymer transport system component